MKKKNILILFLTIVLVASLIGGTVFLLTREKPSEDALKFKEEYESLNGTIRESDGAKYNEVKVSSVNPIVYVDAKRTLDVLEENQAIIYVGANWCPWCRNAVPVLFDVASKYGVDKIYYLNLDNEKSSFEVKDGKLEKTKDGSEAYYKLLEKLKDRLSDYTLEKDGTKYETGEKRIYMPYVIGIRNGKVVEDHVGTVNLDDNQTKYDAMSEKQKNELKSKYEELFEAVYGKDTGSCDDNVCY